VKRIIASAVITVAALLSAGNSLSADEGWQGWANRKPYPPAAGLNGREYNVQIFSDTGEVMFATTIRATSDMSAYGRAVRIMRWVGGSSLSVGRQQF